MSARVNIDQRALDALLNDVNGPVGKELTRRAIRVEAAAKRYAPVDTGRLRSSIQNSLSRDADGLVAKVGTDVEYALYQEMGTRHQPGTPFLRPALGAAK